MSFFSEIPFEEPFFPYAELQAAYGFVPNLFRAQSGLPRALAALVSLLRGVALTNRELRRLQKEKILLAVASVCENAYGMAFHAEILHRLHALERDLEGKDEPLLDFAVKLATCPAWISGDDVGALKRAGYDDGQIFEAVLSTALGRLLCVSADGLGASTDSDCTTAIPAGVHRKLELATPAETPRPYLPCPLRKPHEFPPFAFLQEQLGFVPNLFQAQTLRPDIIEAEVGALGTILFSDEVLSHVQKELILLVTSAANLNTYCVAVHSQILSLLGVSLEDCDQIVSDHRQASISVADKVLLDSAVKLAVTPSQFGRDDIARLRSHALSEAHILEVVATSSLAHFLNTVQIGLGAVPDFVPRHVFTQNKLHPLSDELRPSSDVISVAVERDADAELVARSQQGDTGAFEELVRRHTRRIFSTLLGMLGNSDDARDALQNVFMRAFEHIGSFQSKSKFSTWLTSIAMNSAIELLRTRRVVESLDEHVDDETFRPRQLHSWVENPEQLVSSAQMRDLVRQAVHRLPEKYRSAVLLRDIGQLSTEEAAATLGLGVPALKARLLRGRLMVREALAPHFAPPEARSARAEL